MSRIEEFYLDISPLSQNPRKIWVYLPESYDRTKKKYDVLYMFDGHNLFDDNVATYGKSWGIRDYLDQTGIDLIVVGQDCNHYGSKRMDEYCPMKAERLWGDDPIKAEGDITGEWFVNVLKKECEKRYRVYKSRNHVSIGGSSMGGLMAEYMMAKYSHVFGSAACISPAHYYCWEGLNQLLDTNPIEKSRIFFSYGTEEIKGSDERWSYMMESLLTMSNRFEEKG
ncbi:MAG: alpha/beta hydrolase-fold protein, partial [Erysipelotrichaceae bacterium]|nr:alpha/beta hydrolase-fold protein [Erysipelotrichaceae bacterium]